MGLIHPSDLEAFRRDEASRQSFSTLRRMTRTLRPPGEDEPLYLTFGGDAPDLLFAWDSRAISSRAAVLDPLEHLPVERVAVLSPFAADDVGLSGPVQRVHDTAELRLALPRVTTVISAGNHARAGALVDALARQMDGSSVVVQHGMLLPQAAPLPTGVHAVVWSDADGDFWASGRSDVTLHALGSQLLHRASLAVPLDVPVDGPPVYVGALHGTELPRHQIERIARKFCLATGARYRPHPSETDLQSRATHLIWRQLGIAFEDSGVALLELAAPVVGMWSTGILEAATAGRPAWVYHPDPPAWLTEVWDRYGLRVWGADPRSPQLAEAVAPASRIADLVIELGDAHK